MQKQNPERKICINVDTALNVVDKVSDVGMYAAIGTLGFMGAGIVAGGTFAMGLPAAGLGALVGISSYAKVIYKIIK